jgi:hypothetical protein
LFRCWGHEGKECFEKFSRPHNREVGDAISTRVFPGDGVAAEVIVFLLAMEYSKNTGRYCALPPQSSWHTSPRQHHSKVKWGG